MELTQQVFCAIVTNVLSHFTTDNKIHNCAIAPKGREKSAIARMCPEGNFGETLSPNLRFGAHGGTAALFKIFESNSVLNSSIPL